ncbi:MAG TPA: penicillin-binding protein 2, partial [Candidatus Sulfotelmatobacter sp.]|nr:penicillin-binding protein 2 [Candidatus Sulfotelmatobacter sp.]
MEIKKYNLLAGAALLVFAVLTLRLAQLQLLEGPKYRQLSDDNAAKTVPAPAPRGIIFDRNGKVLVTNRPIFAVHVMPQVMSGTNSAEVLRRLGELLGEEVAYKVSPDQPIIIKDNVPPAVAFRIEEQKDKLEGVVVSVHPVRYYPHGSAAAHVLGYVGEIAAADLAKLKGEGYRPGDSLGKDGVEKYYDKMIRGVDGGIKVEVDVHGRPKRLLRALAPLPGADVKLTIDLDLQLAAEKALAGKAGAVVIVDPRSGEVLALASSPAYDPNIFIDPLNAAQWERLSAGRNPFMNRALSIYPPGSIFKAVTLSAALAEGVAKPDEVIYCPGYYKINNRIAKCWKEGGHGRITVQEGLTQSCDVVFYEMGRRLGPERLAQYAQKYGLGEKTGIDIPQEKKGLVPTTEWKKTVLGEPWYDGDSINYGIGQGFLQVTPLQMAQVYGTIAVGRRQPPFIVSEIKDRNGEILYQHRPAVAAPAPVANSILTVIRQALHNVVDRATGIAAKVPGLPAAGKTGTAE